ncbi:unnamed protein product, partial [Polarella glacialis]
AFCPHRRPLPALLAELSATWGALGAGRSRGDCLEDFWKPGQGWDLGRIRKAYLQIHPQRDLEEPVYQKRRRVEAAGGFLPGKELPLPASRASPKKRLRGQDEEGAAGLATDECEPESSAKHANAKALRRHAGSVPTVPDGIYCGESEVDWLEELE